MQGFQKHVACLLGSLAVLVVAVAVGMGKNNACVHLLGPCVEFVSENVNDICEEVAEKTTFTSFPRLLSNSVKFAEVVLDHACKMDVGGEVREIGKLAQNLVIHTKAAQPFKDSMDFMSVAFSLPPASPHKFEKLVMPMREIARIYVDVEKKARFYMEKEADSLKRLDAGLKNAIWEKDTDMVVKAVTAFQGDAQTFANRMREIAIKIREGHDAVEDLKIIATNEEVLDGKKFEKAQKQLEASLQNIKKLSEPVGFFGYIFGKRQLSEEKQREYKQIANEGMKSAEDSWEQDCSFMQKFSKGLFQVAALFDSRANEYDSLATTARRVAVGIDSGYWTFHQRRAMRMLRADIGALKDEMVRVRAADRKQLSSSKDLE